MNSGLPNVYIGLSKDNIGLLKVKIGLSKVNIRLSKVHLGQHSQLQGFTDIVQDLEAVLVSCVHRP